MLVRKLAAVAVAASVAFGTAGCTFMNPIATQNAYQPGNGVNANLGDARNGVVARNFVYLVNATGTGVLIGTLVNQGSVDSTIALTPANGKATTVVVAAGKTLDFGYNGNPGIDLGITANAGSLVDITASASSTVAMKVPVLDGTFSEYAGLVPAVSTATPTPAKTNG